MRPSIFDIPYFILQDIIFSLNFFLSQFLLIVIFFMRLWLFLLWHKVVCRYIMTNICQSLSVFSIGSSVNKLLCSVSLLYHLIKFIMIIAPCEKYIGIKVSINIIPSFIHFFFVAHC
jgi:hypothetical protein